MEDRMAPNPIEAAIPERQAFAIGLDELNAHLIRVGTLLGFLHVTMGEIEGRHAGAAPGEHHRCHAVATPVVEHAQTAEAAELLESRPDPGLVLQVQWVLET